MILTGKLSITTIGTFRACVLSLLTVDASAVLKTADYNITFNSNRCVLEGGEHLVIIGIDHLS